jgi:hypothetical protein
MLLIFFILEKVNNRFLKLKNNMLLVKEIMEKLAQFYLAEIKEFKN